MLLQPGYKRGACELCDHCSLLKRNSSILPEQRDFVKKRECDTSNEDLKEKIRCEQKRRRNAERRANYQKNRRSSEMKAFEDEDQDFVHMFKKLEKNSLSDDMKILF